MNREDAALIIVTIVMGIVLAFAGFAFGMCIGELTSAQTSIPAEELLRYYYLISQ